MDEIAADVAYIQRRAAETGFKMQLCVSRSGFTISALVGETCRGSSTYKTEKPTDPLPPGCLRTSVDMAIANATGRR